MSSYIDSRELVRQRNDLIDLKGVDVNEDDDVAEAVGKLNGFTEEQQEELDELNSTIEEIGEESAEDGVTMIPEDEFVDYVENYCNECGYIGNDTPSFIVIDWETTADNFKQDFDEVTHEGYTYYYQQN